LPCPIAVQTHSQGIEDTLLRYQDLVLKARKRCDVAHGKDMAITHGGYED